MLKRITPFALFLQTAFLSAQTDSIHISSTPEIRTEQGVLEPQRIVNPYDEVFGIHEPARWLFKWDIAAFLPSLGFDPQEYDYAEGGLRFDAEWKPGTAFSLNASYQLGLQYLFDDTEISTHSFRIEPRWYMNMRKRVDEGRGAANFSGNYLGLELTQVIQARKLPSYSNEPRLLYHGAMTRFGLQRRLFGYGFFDLSYGIGVRHYNKSAVTRGGTRIFSEARVAVGLALARPKTAVITRNTPYCEVLQCFREERRMLKVDLLNIFRIISTDFLAGTARVALEQKIGASPFSFELEGHLTGYYSNYNQSTIKQQSHKYGYGLQLQSRYYYNMNRRIATGKSGNNLSGAYIALQGSWAWWHATLKSLDSSGGTWTSTGERAHLKTGLLWGMQYRLFRNGFIDFNLGAGWGEEYNGKNSSTNHNPLKILGGLRVGLAF